MITTTAETPDAIDPSESYSTCPSCRQPRTYYYWCASCEFRRYQEESIPWTSGSRAVDTVIKDIQRNAPSIWSFIEWIPFAKFRDVKVARRGGFSTVYSAIWDDGPRDGPPSAIDETGRFRGLPMWERTGSCKVALKVLHKSREMKAEYFDEFKKLCRIAPDGSTFDNFTLQHITRICAFTQDPKSLDYVLVMKFCDQTDLHHALTQQGASKSWVGDFVALKHIASGLSLLHRAGLVHGNLHAGNILQDGKSVYITDMGIRRPADAPIKAEKGVYGVMPYMAPEVLLGGAYTPKSDVYSFGMIMWEVFTRQQPFADRPHDNTLQMDIYNGMRPVIDERIPGTTALLINQCWDPDPAKRPTAEDLALRPMVASPIGVMSDVASTVSSVSAVQIAAHPGAVYSSRFIKFLAPSGPLPIALHEQQQVDATEKPESLAETDSPVKEFLTQKLKEIRKYQKMRTSADSREWKDQDFRMLIDWFYWTNLQL